MQSRGNVAPAAPGLTGGCSFKTLSGLSGRYMEGNLGLGGIPVKTNKDQHRFWHHRNKRRLENDPANESPPPADMVRSRADACALPTPFSAMHWYKPSSCGPTLETRSIRGVRRWRGEGERGTALCSHVTAGAGLPRAWQVKRTVSPNAASCCRSSTATWGGSGGKTTGQTEAINLEISNKKKFFKVESHLFTYFVCCFLILQHNLTKYPELEIKKIKKYTRLVTWAAMNNYFNTQIICLFIFYFDSSINWTQLFFFFLFKF